LPGATEAKAVDSYATEIQESIACITDARLIYTPSDPSSAFPFTLKFDAMPPEASLGASGLLLFFAQGFSVGRQPSGEWKVSTEAYIYAVKDRHYGKLFSYDWHPAKFRKDPHFHISQGASIRGMNRRHFPSGRIAIESLIRFLIEEIDGP
jgi:hypothetical protein